jgi:hypothetical protein
LKHVDIFASVNWGTPVPYPVLFPVFECEEMVF